MCVFSCSMCCLISCSGVSSRAPNRNHTWIWVIGAFTACVQSTALWLMESPSLHSISHHALFYAMYVTSVTMLVPLVLVTPARFPMMGYLLLNFHSPIASRSSAAVASVVGTGLLIVATPILFLGGHEEGRSEMLSGSIPIVAVLVLTPAVCRAFFINSRLVWQVCARTCVRHQCAASPNS